MYFILQELYSINQIIIGEDYNFFKQINTYEIVKWTKEVNIYIK